MSPKRTHFYAVARGNLGTTGIYTNWEDCKKVTQGVKGVIHQGFPTLKDAIAFMRDHKVRANIIPPPSFLESLNPAARSQWDSATVAEQHALYLQSLTPSPPIAVAGPQRDVQPDAHEDEPPSNERKKRKTESIGEKMEIEMAEEVEVVNNPKGVSGMETGWGGRPER